MSTNNAAESASIASENSEPAGIVIGTIDIADGCETHGHRSSRDKRSKPQGAIKKKVKKLLKENQKLRHLLREERDATALHAAALIGGILSWLDEEQTDTALGQPTSTCEKESSKNVTPSGKQKQKASHVKQGPCEDSDQQRTAKPPKIAPEQRESPKPRRYSVENPTRNVDIRDTELEEALLGTQLPVEDPTVELDFSSKGTPTKGDVMYGSYRPYDTGYRSDASQYASETAPVRPMMSSSLRDEVTSPYRSHRDMRLIRDIEDFCGFTLRSKQRLIGELAFQLDRRVLGYVFGYYVGRSDPRRFYGYSVKNIPDKIMQESYADPAFDGVERHLREIRYDTVMSRLRSHGYMVSIHSDMCADLVNTFGLLPIPHDRLRASALFFWDNRRALKDVLRDVTPIQLWPDICIVFECLASMALHDGKPMINW